MPGGRRVFSVFCQGRWSLEEGAYSSVRTGGNDSPCSTREGAFAWPLKEARGTGPHGGWNAAMCGHGGGRESF